MDTSSGKNGSFGMGWVDTFPKRQEMSPTFSERLGFKAMAHLMRMTMVYSKQKVSKLQPEILTLTFYWSLLYISMYNYYIIMLKTWKRPFPTGFCWICSHVLRISTFAISKWTESPRYGPVSPPPGHYHFRFKVGRCPVLWIYSLLLYRGYEGLWLCD